MKAKDEDLSSERHRCHADQGVSKKGALASVEFIGILGEAEEEDLDQA